MDISVGTNKLRKTCQATIKYLSLDEVKRLMKVCQECSIAGQVRGLITPVRDWMIIDLILNTGLRVAEAANLRISDIHIHDGKGRIYVRNGNCSKPGEVYISDKLKKHLQEFIKWKGGRGEPLGDDDHLFMGQRGPLGRQGIQQVVKKYLKKACLPEDYSAHSLRHTYGTLYYRVTRDLRATQKQLRHTSIRNTQIYADTYVSKDDLKTQADRLSEFYQ